MKQKYKIFGLVILTIIQSCGLKSSPEISKIRDKSDVAIFEKYSNDSIRNRIFRIAYENKSSAPSYVIFNAIDLNTKTKKEICCEAPFLSGAMHRELGKDFDEISSKYIDSLILGNKAKVFKFKNKDALKNISFTTYPDNTVITKIATQNDLDYYFREYGTNDSIKSMRFDSDSEFAQETFAHIMFKCGVITSRDCVAGNYIWFGYPNLRMPKIPDVNE